MIKTTFTDGRELEIPETPGEKLAHLEAGDLEAGGLELVVPTPEMRRAACIWLKDKEWATAMRMWIDSLYCVQEPGAREVDHMIAWQAYETLRMLLWVTQCAGLVEIACDMQREMTLDSDDQETLRRAQAIAEARLSRLTQSDRDRIA